MAPSQDRNWIVVGVAVAIGAVLVIGVLWAPQLHSSGGPARGLVFRVSDDTPSLDGVFHPGVILGVVPNASSALLAGIGVYTKSPDYSLPVAASLSPSDGALAIANLTAAVNAYFWEGGVYGAAWNGSAWLVAGQAGWGDGNFGSAIFVSSNGIVNITGELGAAFDGGGIWAVGWNGTDWLVGGNSSAEASLLAIRGGSVTNLSGELRATGPSPWIQLLAWNGNEWLVGGHGILETIQGATVDDLLPDSAFAQNGVYAGGWNGTDWVVGGGTGAIAILEGGTLAPGPALPAAFDQVVLFVAPVPGGGWVVGGKGTGAAGSLAPELVYWDGTRGTAGVTDLSGSVPASFGGGEIQAGCAAPFLGPSSFLLVGDGDYDNATGYGTGALAVLSVQSG